MKENKYVYKEAKTSFGQIDKRQHELVTHVEFNKYINEFLTQGNHQDDALVEMYGVASEHETRLETAEDTLVNHTKQLVNHEMRVTKAEGTLVNHDNRITHNTNMNNAQDEVINNLNERLKVVEDNNADFKVVTVFANNVQKVETFVAQAGQRNFRLNLASYIPGQNRLAVYVNGVQQTINDGFVEVDSRTFQFTEGLTEGMKVTAHYFTEETSDDLTDIMETIKEGPAILEGLLTNGESRVNEFIQSGETTINGFLSEGEREVEELVTKGENAFDTLVQRAEQVKADSILVQPTKPKPSDNCDIWFDTSEDDFLTLQDYEEARNQAFNNQMATFESRFSEIKGEKGDKGEPGVGVLESDFKDYMGGVHETLREVHKANVEYTVRTAVGEFNHLDYEGQHITATNTIEGHVKSAMLKGNTLVNLHKLENYSVFGVVLDGGINQQFGNNTSFATWRMFDISMLKPNTEYGVFCWVLENTLSEKYWSGHTYHSADTVFNPSTELRFSAGETGLKFAKLTTVSDFTGKTCGIRHLIDKDTPSTEYVKFRCVIVEYQDGMENWDIPYFTGMQSVRMPVLKTTGKNLFDGELEYGSFSWDGGSRIAADVIIRNVNPIKVNTSNICFTSTTGDIRDVQYVFQYDEHMNFIGYITNAHGQITLDSNTRYINIRTQRDTGNGYVLRTLDDYKIQIEEGTVATPYEPFKSNILTVNEEVTLRGIGEVKDELNLLTGELTQRISEVVLDGSEYWVVNPNGLVNTYDYYCNIGNKKSHNYVAMLPQITMFDDKFGIVTTLYDINNIGMRIEKDKLTSSNVESFKDWLSQNPITIQYELATESVKTVVLSDNVVYSYDEVTHYESSSEDGSLVPTLAVKVPTDVQAVITDQSATIQTLEQENQALKKTQDTLLVVQLGMMEHMATTLAESEEQPAYLKALRQLASERGLR